MKGLVLVLSWFFILAGPAYSFATLSSVAVVRTLSNSASITRNGTTTPAEMNTKIFNGDVIKTGPNGSLGLIFDDDTTVSLGPSSKFSVENFLFSPANKQLAFWVKMFNGTFSFLSGQITKLAPDKVRLETPDATIGLRGTHVLVKVEGR